MSEPTLEDRYVSAVLTSVPDAQRRDVEAELRASIADAIDARVEMGHAVESATVSVLEGLGDPDVLAADLAGRPLWLIGPGNYLSWARLLKLLLSIVVPIVGVAFAGAQIATGATILEGLLGGAWNAASTALHLVFWVTLVFFILERTGETGHLTEWSVDLLPSPQESSISLAETVISVATSTAMIALLVAVRDGATVTPGGMEVPLFASGVWDFWLPVVIGVLALDVIFEMAKFRRGRWTSRLAAVNLVINAGFAGVVSWLLLSGRLLSPELVAAVEAQVADPQARSWLDVTILITVLVVIGIAAWSVIEGFVKARRWR